MPLYWLALKVACSVTCYRLLSIQALKQASKEASKHVLLIVLQEYMQKMAQCLLDLSDNSQSKSLVDLQRYSLEMAAAHVCCWMGNAQRAAGPVKESLSIQDNPYGQEGLPDNQYEDMLVNTHFLRLQELFKIV